VLCGTARRYLRARGSHGIAAVTASGAKDFETAYLTLVGVSRRAPEHFHVCQQATISRRDTEV